MADGVKSSDIFARPGPLDNAMKVWATKVWDKDDGRSVLRLAPETIQRAMCEIPEADRNLSEAELRKMIRPTPADNQLRISFWLEYDRVQSRMLPQMETTNIIRGIITEDYFYKRYMKDLKRVAWMLIPPTSYTVKLTEMLEVGLGRMRGVLDLDPVGPDGKVNTKLLELQLKITAMMDMRLNGAIAQKVQIEQKNMNMNLHLTRTSGEISGLLESGNMEELDKKLAELRKRDAMISQGVHPHAEKPETVVVAAIEDGEFKDERPETESS
jgi:hypothetical protein